MTLAEELAATVKPQLLKKAETDIDTMIAAVAPAIVSAHNTGVDSCIALVDVILTNGGLSGGALEMVLGLRAAMLKCRE